MKPNLSRLFAALGLLLLVVSSQAQNASLTASVVMSVTDFSQNPASSGINTNLVATGKASFLSPISVDGAVTFGPGRSTAAASGQAGRMRCRSTGGFDYFVPSANQGGYTECTARVSVEDFVTVSSTTLPPGTVVTLSFTLSTHGTVSAPAADQARPGITADLSANVVAATLVATQFKALSHLQGTLGTVTYDVQATVGETFRLLYELDASTYLSSSIADYRDLSSDGYTADQGATLSIMPQDPANVSLTATSGYDYGTTPNPTGGSDPNSAPFVTETDAELAAPMDANADGQPDYLVIDKATGIRRIGLQQPDGSFQWADPASTGIENVTGLGIGHFAATGAADGFAVAAPLWNRVNVFPDAQSDSMLAPSVGIGPDFVVGIDFAGDTRDDLAIGTIWDRADIQTHLSGLVSDAGGLSLNFGPHEETGPLSQGNRTHLAPNGPWLVGAFREGDQARDFVLRSVSSSASRPDGPTLSGLPSDTEWCWGQFQTNTPASFLFYSPGASNLYVTAVQGAAPGPYSWPAGDNYAFDRPISRVIVLPAGPVAMLLIVFEDGNSAATYDFDGNNAPVLRQRLSAPAGLKFSTGGALANGAFILLGGPNGAHGASTTWQHWGFDGTQHKLLASGALPGLNVSQTRANVLLFTANPDLDQDAMLVRTLRVGDWSDSAAPLGGNLQVIREQFLGTSPGLGSPGTTNVPALASLFPVVNQHAPADSVAVFEPPTVAAFSGLSFSPAPGTYHTTAGAGLQVRMSSASGAPIFYRLGVAQPWIAYSDAAPPTILTTTTFQAYVDDPQPSPLQSATYVIADAPGIVVGPATDANHNGLPDAWEQAFGVSDPNGDPDGDGATNLQEYLAGTDPLDATSVPSVDPGDLGLVARFPGAGAPAGTLCEIAWLSSPASVVLESTEDLNDPSSWSAAGGTDVTVGTERIHYEPESGAREVRYYRLRVNP